MIKGLILADDLTGALDTGIQFAKKYLSTMVVTEKNLDNIEISNDVEILIIDTETRHLNKEEAKLIIKKVIKLFKKIPTIKFFYKKIDSTFRGNIGSEIEAFMDELNIKDIPFIPAFPDNERTIKNAKIYVHNIEITDTEFSKDRLNPIKDSYIPNILAEQTNIKYKIENSYYFGKKLDKLIEIYDTTSNKDLENIFNKTFFEERINYFVGSAGFAGILADKIGRGDNTCSMINTNYQLLVCGTVNNISLQQCVYAEKIGYIPFKLKYENIIKNNYINTSNFCELKAEINKLLLSGKKILIKTEKSSCKSEQNKIQKISKIISKNIALIVKDIVMENKLKGMIVFGGDTLISIANELDCKSLLPISELLPGVVLTKLQCKEFDMFIVAKSGGFGNENVVEQIIANNKI